MAIEISMPALSPTMETGTLARWLVKPGDRVKSGDVLAEIETDKATMEFEAIDEGEVLELLVAEGAEDVRVGTPILRLAGEDEPPARPAAPAPPPAPAAPAPVAAPVAAAAPAPTPAVAAGERVMASPLARRVAAARGLELAGLRGSGPRGRIVLADVEAALGRAAAAPAAPPAAAAPAAAPPAAAPPAAVARAPAAVAAPAAFSTDIPHRTEKLGNVRKVIARRLTEAKQQVPHFYLGSDIRIDALLKLRSELNAALAPRGLKVSVNDLIIKALAVALRMVPKCNVSFAGDALVFYERADISVAVAAPSGLITPIIVGADAKAVSAIAEEMKALAARARDGKLQPHEYQGGTASLSNLGMYGIRQFDAVINPPQGMILAVGAGEKRPWVEGDSLVVAQVMSVTGSFDHRAIDGADGAELMKVLKELLEAPLGLVA